MSGYIKIVRETQIKTQRLKNKTSKQTNKRTRRKEKP